ncbi:hypothetical protein ACLSSQ_00490 [Azospira sp. APE16]|uniref:hypothetical protein n=1 Tax=unclassified Azospira TaxID=2609269 RepID=UPI002564D84E|nr:hypothetical protein [Azospira sp.]MDK9690528.1 hypothetical protein [Azospira sp.]
MRHALGELRRLLQGPDASTGVVASVQGDVVKVATRVGLLTLKASGTVTAGDRVTISDGVAKPAPKAGKSYPV